VFRHSPFFLFICLGSDPKKSAVWQTEGKKDIFLAALFLNFRRCWNIETCVGVIVVFTCQIRVQTENIMRHFHLIYFFFIYFLLYLFSSDYKKISSLSKRMKTRKTKRKRSTSCNKGPKAKKTKQKNKDNDKETNDADVIMTDVESKSQCDRKIPCVVLSNRQRLQFLLMRTWMLGDIELLQLFLLSNRFESWVCMTYQWENQHLPRKCVYKRHDLQVMREIIESYRVAILNEGLLDDANGCPIVRLTWMSPNEQDKGSNERPLPEKAVMGGISRLTQFCISLRNFAMWEYSRRKIAQSQLFLRNLLIIYWNPILFSRDFAWDQTKFTPFQGLE
jgi:hypothetical protein